MFGEARVFCSFSCDDLPDFIQDGKRVRPLGQEDLQLVPQPLACSREIEVMPLYGIAVDESDAASCGMPGIVPIPGFEQHGTEQADFDHFAAHAIDLDPIALPNSVFSHEHEPAEEADDEILQRNR